MKDHKPESKFTSLMIKRETHRKLVEIKQLTHIGMSVWIELKVEEAHRKLFPNGN